MTSNSKTIPTKNLVLTALFTALTTVGAFIRIPLPYVPITLQTIFVIMAGLLLGKKMGAISQLLYVGLGILGVPVFIEGGGPGYILKPSFGYLLGFIVAAYIVGYLTEKREITFVSTLVISLAGLLVIYLIGVPYLYFILTRNMGVSLTFYGAFKTGMLVFLPGALLKMLLVSAITPRLYRSLRYFMN